MTDETTTQAPRPTGRRGMGGWADMVRSMGLIAGVSVLLTAFALWPINRDPVQEVDLAAIAIGAAKQADFKPLVPELGPQWRPTSARVEPAADDISNQNWHIGYVGPDEQYHAIEQSNTVLVDRFIEFWTDGLTGTDAPVELGGVEWRLFLSEAGQAVYVSTKGELTLCVVTSTAPEGQSLVAAAAAAWRA